MIFRILSIVHKSVVIFTTSWILIFPFIFLVLLDFKLKIGEQGRATGAQATDEGVYFMILLIGFAISYHSGKAMFWIWGTIMSKLNPDFDE